MPETYQSWYLAWVTSGADVEGQSSRPGHHCECDVDQDAAKDDPQVDKEVPEVVIQRSWVLHPVNEDVP